MYNRGITSESNPMGDWMIDVAEPKWQFAMLFSHYIHEMGLQIDLENSVFIPFEKFADIYFWQLQIENKTPKKI